MASRGGRHPRGGRGRQRSRSANPHRHDDQGEGQGWGGQGGGRGQDQGRSRGRGRGRGGQGGGRGQDQGRGRGQGEGRGRGGQGGGRGQDQGRGRGRGWGRSSRWDDTTDYNSMINNQSVKQFVTSRLFKASDLNSNDFLVLVSRSMDIERSDKVIRHQFLIRLTQSPFLEMQGPILGTIQNVINPSYNCSEREKAVMLKGFLKLLDLLEEMMTRIPDCRNTRPYTSTTISLMAMVPFLSDELKSRMEDVKSQLSDPSQLQARINDPSHNWSPDVSFIAEPIIPESLEQLLYEELDKCFINPIKGGYKSPAHYLETWYRMMREDFMGPLRGAIKDFKSIFKADDKLKKRIRVDGGYHYTLEKVLDRDKLEGQYYCLIQFSTEELKHVNWEHTDRLRFDSIMVLSDDHYQTARYAVITGHDKKRAKHGQVWLKMIGGPLAMDRNFRGIEPMAFYEPYRCVLERLKILAARVHDNQALPMSRYFVDVNKTVRPPDYMKNGSDLELASGAVTQTQFPNLDYEGLDFSQKEALKLALTHEIALIQGPPGTGKSYVGAMFVCIMMLNKHLWQRHDRGRMLLLAYKNHAIDQFIGECERMGMDMSTTVRVGSRSDISMDKYQLRNKRKQLKDLHEYSGVNHEMRDIRLRLVEVEKVITMSERVMKTRNREMSYGNYQQYLPGNYQYQFNCAFQKRLAQNPAYQMEQVIFEWMAGDIRAVTVVMETIDREEPMPYTTAEQIYYTYDIFQLPLELRRQLYAFWCEYVRDEAERCLVGCRDWHEQLTDQLNQMRRRQDIAVVHRSDIVAMTTTGASKHGYLLDAANPCIVLVEEAAEVLETHIVAPLTKGCKHVVLIGDHQQLRPQVSNFAMEKKNLTISLFERLITNEVPSRRLQIQHRMHPEIASLLVPHIYSSLDNHDTVLNYPRVRGLRKRMHFFCHDHPEERIGEKSSCRNAFEADYVVGLCHYLLLQDYEPSDITILSTYMGQMRLIKQKMQSFCKEHPQPMYTEYEKKQMLEREFKDYLDQKRDIDNGDRKMRDMDNKTKSWYNRRAEEYKSKKERLEGARSKMQDVRVTTVDNYQGEECTIILLSFVRSNAVCNIGFLKWPNRICVALSRAKHGFYAIGDFKLFAKNTKSDLWKKLCAQMLYEDSQQSELDRVQRPDPNLSAKLELECVNHKSIRELQDPCKFLELAPEGGCLRSCQYRLRCGHTCTRLCHHIDADHVQFTCKKNCEGFLDCTHMCQRRCDKDGDDRSFFGVQNFEGCFRKCLSCTKNIRCKAEVTMTPSCGHTGTTECSNKPIYACQTRVEFTLDCSHKKVEACSTDKKLIKCVTLVEEPLACGHVVKRKCHNKNPDCKTQIWKLLSCGIHKKIMYCYERNNPVSCVTEVEINPSCGHTRMAPCCEKDTESRKSCKVLVPKKLECGHTKEVTCFTSHISTECCEMVEIKLPCRHSTTLPCSKAEAIKKRPSMKAEIKCLEKVQFKLICGHEIERLCYDKETKSCEKIKTEMLKCGHQVKGKCHEFERIKRKGCQQKVEATEPCGHKVNIDCGGDIKELPYVRCAQNCLIHCVHTRCTKECNKPCTPCIEPCPNGCPHQKCTRACYQDCDRQPCNLPCAKIMTCGHVCGGICGELCPTGCTKCRKNARKGRRIRILPCHHDFSPAQLDEHMKVREDQRVQEVVSKLCPLSRCGAVISHCPRYANQIKRYQQVTKLREYTTESTWWYCKKGGHFVKTSKQSGLDTASRHSCSVYRELNVQYQYEQYERHRAAEERELNEEDGPPDHRPADLTNNAFFRKVARTDRFAGRGIGRGGRGVQPQAANRPVGARGRRPRNAFEAIRELMREPLLAEAPRPRRAQSVAELDRIDDEIDRLNLDDTDDESTDSSDSDSDESVHDDVHRWIYDLY